MDGRTETDRQDGEGFRMNTQGLLLTYPTHISKEKLLKFLQTRSTINVKFYHICHETGDTGHEHTHVLLWYIKAVNIKNARKYDYEGHHPNIANRDENGCVMRAKDIPRVVSYLQKEDEHPLSNVEKKAIQVQCVLGSASIEEALGYTNTLGEVLGAVAAYKNRPKEKKLYKIPAHPLKAWQTWVIEYLEEPADDRHVLWVQDDVGCSGKSWLAKYVFNRFDDVRLFKSSLGQKDGAGMIPESTKIIWFDLARSYEDRSGIYDMMECLKDGTLTSGKYEGTNLQLDGNVHVVVTANFPPNRRKLTKDRWIIKKISAIEDANKLPDLPDSAGLDASYNIRDL